jgi:lactoylglutathione lyase
MRIEHIAIWVKDLEGMRDFYTRYFKMNCSKKYVNDRKKFSSYFLSFESGARIEIMHRTDITEQQDTSIDMQGLAHFAIAVGNKEKVDQLTDAIHSNGFLIVGEPRITGDGYYESIVQDPEGNKVEITE